jgi:polysaccharide export outer membrane protein
MRLCTYRMLLVTAAAMLALPLAVSAQSAPAPTPAKLEMPGSPHALRINSGDLLEVGVFDTPELSGKLRVDEHGEVTIPIAGVLQVAGMTAEEAAVAIEAKLRDADLMTSPHVTVFITEFATQGVTMTGEVKSPGIYPLLGSHGLVDLLTAAGGATASAGRVVSITHKNDPEHPQMVRLASKPGEIIENVDIQPGDTVVVARAGVCYVVGDVAKTGGFLIESNDRLTVLQIMALAGGATRTSAKDKARLIRKTPSGREEMPIPLNAMMKGKVKDMPVEDGDILFVPSSGSKAALYRGTDSIIAITTGLAVGGRF